MEGNTSTESILYQYDEWSIGLVVLTWVLAHLVISPLVLGIISFNINGNTEYQTLVDKIHVYWFSIIFLYILTGFNVTCFGVFKSMPVAQIEADLVLFTGALISAERLTLRFLYSVVWKNVGKLNDELFGRFFLVLNCGLGVAFSSFEALTGSYQNVTMVFCTGFNPHQPVSSKMSSSKLLVVIPLYLYNLAVLVITHMKTRKTAFASQVNSGFAMSTFFNLALILSAPIVIPPRRYIRYLLKTGNMSQCPPLVLTTLVFAPIWIVLIIVPLMLFARNAPLRKYFIRSITESVLFQKLMAFPSLMHSSEVAPS